jgi:hypothetical protein
MGNPVAHLSCTDHTDRRNIHFRLSRLADGRTIGPHAGSAQARVAICQFDDCIAEIPKIQYKLET